MELRQSTVSYKDRQIFLKTNQLFLLGSIPSGVSPFLLAHRHSRKMVISSGCDPEIPSSILGCGTPPHIFFIGLDWVKQSMNNNNSTHIFFLPFIIYSVRVDTWSRLEKQTPHPLMLLSPTSLLSPQPKTKFLWLNLGKAPWFYWLNHTIWGSNPHRNAKTNKRFFFFRSFVRHSFVRHSLFVCHSFASCFFVLLFFRFLLFPFIHFHTHFTPHKYTHLSCPVISLQHHNQNNIWSLSSVGRALV